MFKIIKHFKSIKIVIICCMLLEKKDVLFLHIIYMVLNESARFILYLQYIISRGSDICAWCFSGLISLI